jgi:alpha/beta superfamily hydrolase
MPEVIFAGPEGRLEGRYHPHADKDAPIALILHPHPNYGGTMNNPVTYALHYAFRDLGFTVMRFNFRGVGRSQGEFDQGIGELSDAASSLDYLQAQNQNARACWVAGFSFGAWIGMQLLMRRPEINGFISVAPPANMYDFSFLAPCPSSGLIINGDETVKQAEGAEGHHHHPHHVARGQPLLRKQDGSAGGRGKGIREAPDNRGRAVNSAGCPGLDPGPRAAFLRISGYRLKAGTWPHLTDS